jgi:hypothetical protein
MVDNCTNVALFFQSDFKENQFIVILISSTCRNIKSSFASSQWMQQFHRLHDRWIVCLVFVVGISNMKQPVRHTMNLWQPRMGFTPRTMNVSFSSQKPVHNPSTYTNTLSKNKERKIKMEWKQIKHIFNEKTSQVINYLLKKERWKNYWAWKGKLEVCHSKTCTTNLWKGILVQAHNNNQGKIRWHNKAK